MAEVAFAPFRHKLPQLLRLPLQLQGVLSRTREGAVLRPQDQKRSPFLQERIEKREVRGGHG